MNKNEILEKMTNPKLMDAPTTELLATITQAFNDYERKIRSERIKAGIREAKLRKGGKAE